MGFSRQEYWSELLLWIAIHLNTKWIASLGDLLGPGIEPVSLTSPAWAGRFFTTNSYHLQMIEKLEICLLYMEKVIYMNEKYLMHYGLCGWWLLSIFSILSICPLTSPGAPVKSAQWVCRPSEGAPLARKWQSEHGLEKNFQTQNCRKEWVH